MRLTCLVMLAALVTGIAAPGSNAKEFASIAVVGADGDSREIRASSRVIEGLFAGRVRAVPRGGYVRVCPLGSTGHVGIPGRFYPATGAVCLDWNQAAARGECRRPGAALRSMLVRASALQLFRGDDGTLARLASTNVRRPVVTQLRAAFELAFDRRRLARTTAGPPTRCLPFSAVWRGNVTDARPRRFCLSEKGVYAGRTLYPLGVEPFRLAWLNRR